MRRSVRRIEYALIVRIRVQEASGKKCNECGNYLCAIIIKVKSLERKLHQLK